MPRRSPGRRCKRCWRSSIPPSRGAPGPWPQESWRRHRSRSWDGCSTGTPMTRRCTWRRMPWARSWSRTSPGADRPEIDAWHPFPWQSCHLGDAGLPFEALSLTASRLAALAKPAQFVVSKQLFDAGRLQEMGKPPRGKAARGLALRCRSCYTRQIPRTDHRIGVS